MFTEKSVGATIAGEGGLVADLCFVGCVHIHSCGNGHLWFRSYSGSLLANAPKVTKRSCPTIRPLARARGALTPALLRGPAAIGHPWPGAAIPASMPGCPLRNACVRPLEMGQVDQDQDQKPEPEPEPSNSQIKRSQPSAAPTGECVRLRSGRLSGRHRQQAGSYSRSGAPRATGFAVIPCRYRNS